MEIGFKQAYYTQKREFLELLANYPTLKNEEAEVSPNTVWSIKH